MPDTSATTIDSIALLSPPVSVLPSQPSSLGASLAEQERPRLATTDERRTLKVLHLINGEHFAGAERVQQLLGNRLGEWGIESDFVCLKPGKFPELSGLASERVHLAAMTSKTDLKPVGSIVKLVRENDYDLLHAHTPRAAMIAGMVSWRAKRPWIYHVHSPAARDSTRKWVNRLNDWMEARAIESCSRIITVSKSLRREMLTRGWSRSKLEAIANGVAMQASIDPRERLSCKDWRLGIVALFRPRKGIEVLLRALSFLSCHRPKISLDVIGGFETPEYERDVKGLVRHLGLEDSVHFTGFTKNVGLAMRQLDGLVLPSLFGEGMPMVVLEAMAVGVPVIATRVEGTPEVIRDGREGVLAEPQDPTSLRHAIQRFTADRGLWVQWSEQAHRRQQEKFSDLEMARKTSLAYRKIACHGARK